MLIIFFWMASTLQVLLSILIRIKRISNETATTLSIRASQQKDDILGCLLMGIALISQSTKATEMVYLLGRSLWHGYPDVRDRGLMWCVGCSMRTSNRN
jgi:hypothetical protein